MSCHKTYDQARANQRGQVLAESVVVCLLLVTLGLAIHYSARTQHQWLAQWLGAQVAATAAAHSHQVLPVQASRTNGPPDRWRSQVMSQYGIGHNRWLAVQTHGTFAQTGWRLVGAGQASRYDEVVQRIDAAPTLWRKTALHSKSVIRALLPTLRAIEAPWADRGSPTVWLENWQFSLPEAYRKSTPKPSRQLLW